MIKKTNSKKHFVLLLCIIVVFILSIDVSAFVLTGFSYPLSKKSTLYFEVSSTLNGHTIDSYVKAWNGYSGIKFNRVDTSSPLLKNLTLEFNSFASDSYAVCYHHNRDYKIITFYRDFLSLNSTNKAETIVHEVGHALGLGHCESYYDVISVMRKTGFNNKAYPLIDDIDGIKYIYE